MPFMEDIRSARRELGLSQTELADSLGLHQSTISRLETGELPVDGRTKLAIDALLMRRRADAEQRHCTSCDAKAEAEIAACTSVNCPMRAKEAA